MKDTVRERSGRLRAMLAIVALGFLCPTFAAADEIKAPGYVVSQWGASEGAPQDVGNIAQTADGWIWLGTNNGLFRFDGRHFSEVTIAPESLHPSRDVRDLVPDPAGGLWVLYGNAIELHLGADGRTVTVPKGLPEDGVEGVFVHGDGRTFAFADDHLYVLQGDHWVACEGPAWTLPKESMDTAVNDANGDMIAVAGEAIYRLAKHSQQFVQVMHFDEPIVYSGLLVPDPRGGLWATYRKYTQVTGIRMAKSLPAVNTNGITTFDGSGTFWTVQQDCEGLCRASSESAMADMQAGRRPTRETVIPPGTITAIALLVDSTGDLWVGARQGLLRFHRSVAQPVTGMDTHLGWFGVSPAADGTTLVTTYTRGGYNQIGVFKGDAFQLIQRDTAVSAITRLADGSAVLGGDNAIYRLMGTQLETLAARPGVGPKVPIVPVQVVLPAPGGRLWVSIRGKNLFLLDGQDWQSVGPKEGFPTTNPTTGVTDESGATWFGYADGSLARLPAGATASPEIRRLPSMGGVMSISPGEPFLVGGQTGLAFLDGTEFKPIELRRHGLLRGVTGIVRTKDGDVWLNTVSGLIAIKATELAALRTGSAHDLPFRIVTAADGMPGGAQQVRPLPTLNQAPNGLLWVAGVSGLVTFDPGALGPQGAATPSLTALRNGNGESLMATGGDLEPGARSMEAEMVGLSLTDAGFVDLRYRLLGVDSAWRYAQDNANVSYPDLPPGQFRLEVQARGPSGDWSPSVFSATVNAKPAFFETTWFAVLVGLMAIALVVAGHFYRMAVVRRRHDEQTNVKLHERDRIAREMHDSMLQGMAGVMLRIVAWERDKRAPDDMRTAFKTVAGQLSSLVLEARARVIALRSVASDRIPLPGALRLIGEDHASASSATFEMSVEGRETSLDDLAHLAVLDIMREAIHNAFAHADAGCVQVILRYSDAAFIAEVRDNGRGIPEAVMAEGRRAGHWGMVTMRERAAEIGGTVAIESEAGGTAVVLTLPMRA